MCRETKIIIYGVVLIALLMVLGLNFPILNSLPEKAVSHPSLMGQPILNLTFQGSIQKIITADGIKMDPQPLPVVLPHNMAKSVALTLIGTPGEIGEIEGQIEKHSNKTDVEFGKFGEVVLIVNITPERQISFISKIAR